MVSVEKSKKFHTFFLTKIFFPFLDMARLKKNTKAKNINIRQHAWGTDINEQLSNIEKQVINIMVPASVTGIPSIEESLVDFQFEDVVIYYTHILSEVFATYFVL